jgi:hypothetical protein
VIQSFVSKHEDMETIVVSGKDSANMKLLLTFAGKLGLSVRNLSATDAEELNLAVLIKEGMRTEDVSRAEVMKALEK